jgi:hypothetical protein
MGQLWTDEDEQRMSDLVDGTHRACALRLRASRDRERRYRRRCRQLTADLRAARRRANWVERTYLFGERTTCWDWIAVGAFLATVAIFLMLWAKGGA